VHTYPPPTHLLRDLGLVVTHDGPGTACAVSRLHSGLADPEGRVLTGVAATVCDVVAGGLAARAAAPGWIATSDLHVALVDPPGPHRELRAAAGVLRAGRSTVLVEVDLRVDGTPVGVATAAFAVLGRRAHNPEIPVAATERWELGPAASEAPVLARAGIRPDPRRGATTLTVGPYVRNSLGAVQGGALALLVEAAARHQDPAAPLRVTELHLTYLALARTGPLSARVVAEVPATGARTVEVHDVGAGERLTTLATAVCAPAPRSPGGRR
jgi:acyl-coenzyme A thioesterase PaaI-like protein